MKGLTRSAFRNYFEYVRLQLEHPDIAARRGENWPATMLTRLERHHTGNVRSGLHYRVVTRIPERLRITGFHSDASAIVFLGFRDDLGMRMGLPRGNPFA